ncbi:MAG: hypothetical protein WA721_08420 [Candidatus Binataceae bacterium]|jgi:hypothetical protein
MRLRSAADKIIHPSATRKAAFDQLNDLYAKGSGYAGIMVTRPQTRSTRVALGRAAARMKNARFCSNFLMGAYLVYDQRI